jgi:hypothetical protein
MQSVFCTLWTLFAELNARVHDVDLARFFSRHFPHQHRAGSINHLFINQVNYLFTKQGEWSDWSTPSECSHPCGGGVQFRERLCLNRSVFDSSGYATSWFACLLFPESSLETHLVPRSRILRNKPDAAPNIARADRLVTMPAFHAWSEFQTRVRCQWWFGKLFCW